MATDEVGPAELVADPRRAQLAKLLLKDLPRMQPSALKHHWLTSVANAMNNPVGQARNKATGEIYTVGWVDAERSSPVMLIHMQSEPGARESVYHAFVPKPDRGAKSPETWAIGKLQADEDTWAERHGVQPRDITQRLRNLGATRATTNGLGGWNALDGTDLQGAFPFVQEDRDEMMRGRWYPTSLPPTSKMDHLDPAVLDANVARSADAVAGGTEHVVGATTYRASDRSLRLHHLVVSDEADPEPDPVLGDAELELG